MALWVVCQTAASLPAVRRLKQSAARERQAIPTTLLRCRRAPGRTATKGAGVEVLVSSLRFVVGQVALSSFEWRWSLVLISLFLSEAGVGPATGVV